jgi:hypothetical protein
VGRRYRLPDEETPWWRLLPGPDPEKPYWQGAAHAAASQGGGCGEGHRSWKAGKAVIWAREVERGEQGRTEASSGTMWGGGWLYTATTRNLNRSS